MYAEDRAEPGAGADKYSFQLKDPNTGLHGSCRANATGGAAANAITIVGREHPDPTPLNGESLVARGGLRRSSRRFGAVS
jgi:hypothetical protein